ncbi:hypothetical protein G443_000931 [Actinoalloteichus cyanogriseus DSM 43889]|uniref:Uncharacterized protein n=2 Tax=Actinoalloteichus cyanogriseus TaxID=2893586 RepID=A0ABT1JEU8_ACTCY|nr:hypothetical protein [Actinoalloteichus caeruleus DSM 43889]
MPYGSLAATGTGVTLGGVVLGQLWLVLLALALVLTGALVIRFAFRPGKTPSDP